MSNQTNLSEISHCLACGSDQLVLTLDLKRQPLANSYKDTKDEVQETFPLAINRCKECFHVQLTHAVNPDLLFKNYLYVSGTSNTMKEYFEWFAAYAQETYETLSALRPTSVLDIGCNDGSQLNYFMMNGLKTYGVDPAVNLHQRAAERHTVWMDYFNLDTAIKMGKVFDIIVAQNVFAHNFDPKGFLRAARMCMAGHDSLLFIQTSQADMIKNGEFDTIYHEHVNFFNINSMNQLVTLAGLYLVDVIKTPLHGNSYLFVISKNRTMSRPEHIKNAIEMERKAGLLTDSSYVKYTEKCNDNIKELKSVIDTHKAAGISVVGYGAAAKGMTLLNYGGIELDYIIDDNPLKQGKFTPGTSIPIYGPEKLYEDKPTMFVPLAWNFFDEIKRKIKSKRPYADDLFVTYFPNVKVYRT